jgi:hypothetical protein
MAAIITAGDLWTYGAIGGWRDKTASIIRTRERSFFQSWQLYSSSELGAPLWSAFGIVGIGVVTPGSNLAKAGLRPGDFLAQVNGSPVRSVRDANRLLCRAPSRGVRRI